MARRKTKWRAWRCHYEHEGRVFAVEMHVDEAKIDDTAARAIQRAQGATAGLVKLANGAIEIRAKRDEPKR